ncbi:permease of the major facilitator superfamily [Legionella beliardensis]|uniref:Permease of the major facilitator superfamily n=1 Tax=Legionella beliardensis TaxID=91822 RepID=A0A378ID50_9GAMM|nr:MFS transporter [Legionella beliardensis]STX30224.1 permease of the major facilitator superfamily [Legionella beliardensis]
MKFAHLPFIKPFTYKEFRFLYASELFFFTSVWMAGMVFGLIVTHIKGNSPFYAGLIGFGFNLPMLLGPLSGAIVDRYSRPIIMRIVSLSGFAAALAMAIILLFGWPNFWVMLFLVLIYGFSQCFYFPAIVTNVADIIPDQNTIGNATSLINSTNRVVMFFGYGLGGFLISYCSEGATYWFNALLFLASFVCLLAVHNKATITETKKSVLEEMKAGLVYVKNSLPVFIIVILLGIIGLLGWPYLFLVPVVNRYYLGGTPGTLGLLLAVGGIGGTLGAFYMSARKSVLGLNRIFIIATAILIISMLGLAFCRSILWAMPMLFFIDLGLMLTLTAGMVFIQQLVPAEFQGRVIGIITMVSFGTIPIGSTLFYGLVGSVFNVMIAFGIAAIILLLALGWYIQKLPAIRRIAAPVYVDKGIIKTVDEATHI